MTTFKPFRACTCSSTFETVIAHLRHQPPMQAILSLGSTANRLSAWSDYDLLLILLPGPELEVEFTYIDNRPADVVLTNLETVEQLTSSSRDLTQQDEMLINWLSGAKLLYSRTEQVEDSLRSAVDSPHAGTYDDSASFYLWVESNFLYRKAKRWLTSPLDSYQDALELLLTTAVSAIVKDYFTSRHLMWSGEKQAVEHLKEHDPLFLQTVFATLHQDSLPRKVELYGELLEVMLKPIGGIWKECETSGGWQWSPQYGRAASSWENLFAEHG